MALLCGKDANDIEKAAIWRGLHDHSAGQVEIKPFRERASLVGEPRGRENLSKPLAASEESQVLSLDLEDDIEAPSPAGSPRSDSDDAGWGCAILVRKRLLS